MGRGYDNGRADGHGRDLCAWFDNLVDDREGHAGDLDQEAHPVRPPHRLTALQKVPCALWRLEWKSRSRDPA
jgi:hypothetical protein